MSKINPPVYGTTNRAFAGNTFPLLKLFFRISFLCFLQGLKVGRCHFKSKGLSFFKIEFCFSIVFFGSFSLKVKNAKVIVQHTLRNICV